MSRALAVLVRVHPSFKDDLAVHVARLERDGRLDRIEQLRSDLRDARSLLGRFPHIGTIEVRDEDVVLRRLILRHVPYVLWFVSEGGVRVELTLVRLFHARQARLRPA